MIIALVDIPSSWRRCWDCSWCPLYAAWSLMAGNSPRRVAQGFLSLPSPKSGCVTSLLGALLWSHLSPLGVYLWSHSRDTGICWNREKVMATAHDRPWGWCYLCTLSRAPGENLGLLRVDYSLQWWCFWVLTLLKALPGYAWIGS